MPTSRALLALCLATIVLTGCGGGDVAVPSAEATGNGTGGQGGSPTDPAPTAQTAEEELPAFMGDFDRVCETQVGYGGAAAYAAGTGTHPVVLFTDFGEPPTLIESSVTLPAGWTVTQDSNFEDNSELAAVELVACSRRTEATPNGTMCDFTLDDDSIVTLELTDTAYEVTVYAAATGEQVGDPHTIEAASTECPFIATFKEGDTRFLNAPSEDQYVNALKEFVSP